MTANDQIKEVLGKYDWIIDFAGLERFVDAKLKNLSSGMQVRLGFSITVSIILDYSCKHAVQDYSRIICHMLSLLFQGQDHRRRFANRRVRVICGRPYQIVYLF